MARRSAEADQYRKLYATSAWRALRLSALARDLYTCQHCDVILTEGRRSDPRSATVHHKRPHKGDTELFFDLANLEAVCKGCHDTLLQREEARGYVIGHDVDGRPIDPSHPWNRAHE